MRSDVVQGHVNLAKMGKRDVNGNVRWKYVFMYIDGYYQYNYTKYMKGIGTVREGVLTTTLSPAQFREVLGSDSIDRMKVFENLDNLYKRIEKCQSRHSLGTLECSKCVDYNMCLMRDDLSALLENKDKFESIRDSLKQGFILLPHL